jgi:5-methylcytosine-specific restriction endonuclease McrA
VEAVVKVMPLWKLQTVGKEKLDFLYGDSGHDGSIELRSGVAYCFRQFYSLRQDAVRSAWLRNVRCLNGDLLGETLDLREFLFGAERNALRAVRPVLVDLQRGQCFYCGQAIRGEGGHVDHFIPWAKYPIDLGHNFVLADSRCNGKKRDRMPHIDHLARWSERNRNHAGEIVTALKDQLPCDLACTNRIAYWATTKRKLQTG